MSEFIRTRYIPCETRSIDRIFAWQTDVSGQGKFGIKANLVFVLSPRLELTESFIGGGGGGAYINKQQQPSAVVKHVFKNNPPEPSTAEGSSSITTTPAPLPYSATAFSFVKAFRIESAMA